MRRSRSRPNATGSARTRRSRRPSPTPSRSRSLPSAGADRATLAFLCEAYHEDTAPVGLLRQQDRAVGNGQSALRLGQDGKSNANGVARTNRRPRRERDDGFDDARFARSGRNVAHRSRQGAFAGPKDHRRPGPKAGGPGSGYRRDRLQACAVELDDRQSGLDLRKRIHGTRGDPSGEGRAQPAEVRVPPRKGRRGRRSVHAGSRGIHLGPDGVDGRGGDPAVADETLLAVQPALRFDQNRTSPTGLGIGLPDSKIEGGRVKDRDHLSACDGVPDLDI